VFTDFQCWPARGSLNASGTYVAVTPIDVRYSPESRHRRMRVTCPLRARTGHSSAHWFGLRCDGPQAYVSSDSSLRIFVERQLREERQGVLDRQPLLRCERLKFGLIARAQRFARSLASKFCRAVLPLSSHRRHSERLSSPCGSPLALLTLLPSRC